jgi:hypothetical protein
MEYLLLMDVVPADIVHRWLAMLGMRIPKSWILQRLGTHPEYPSTMSVTDLLDELGIENSAFVVEPAELDQFTQPILAYVDDHKAVVVERGGDLRKFGDRWKGVVVAAEKPANWTLPVALVSEADRQGQRRLSTTVVGLAIAIVCTYAMFSLAGIQALELVLCLAGLLLAISYTIQMWGGSNLLVNKLCGGEQAESGCQAMKTESPRLPFGLTMADAAVAYFSGLVAIHVSSAALSLDGRPLTVALVALGVAVTLYSLHVQYRRIKKWCGLCQAINATIWVLAALQVAQAFPDVSASAGLAVLLLAFVAPGACWIGIRSLLDENFALRGRLVRLGQVHRDRDLFITYLLSQKPLETGAFAGDLVIGNRQAELQIVAVLSFACGNCQEAHAALEALVRSNPDRMGVTFRFKVNPRPTAGGKYHVLRQMLAYADENDLVGDDARTNRMIGDWFSHQDAERFSTQYPAAESADVHSEIEALASWCQEAHVVSTPALFVNGYRLRTPYYAEDLVEHFPAIMEAVSDPRSG